MSKSCSKTKNVVTQLLASITSLPAIVSSAPRRFASFNIKHAKTSRPDSKQRGEQEIYWSLSEVCPCSTLGPSFLRDKARDKAVITFFQALIFEFNFFSSINNCSVPANQNPAHSKVKGENYCSSVFHWYLLCWCLDVRYFQLYQSAKLCKPTILYLFLVTVATLMPGIAVTPAISFKRRLSHWFHSTESIDPFVWLKN